MDEQQKTTAMLTELKTVLTKLKKLNVTSAKIMNGKIRGKTDDSSIIIITPTDAFDFNIGIGDCSTLLLRVNAFVDSSSCVVDADVSNTVRTITFKKGRAKSLYHCMNPKLLTLPNSIEYTPICSFKLLAEDLSLIKTTASTVTGSEIKIVSNGDDITWFNGADANDNVSIDLDKSHAAVEFPFSYKYSMKPILNILALNEDDTLTMSINENGVIQTCSNGLTLYILPVLELGR